MRTNYIIFAIFVLLSIILTWPLALHLDGILKVSNVQGLHQDNYIFLFTMHYFIENLLDGKNPFMIQQALYPDGLGPTNNEFPPLYLFFGFLMYFFNINEIIAHNLFMLITICLSGFFMYLLAFEFLKNKYAAFFSGVVYITSNFFLFFFDAITNMQFQWVPLIFLFFVRLIKQPNYKNAVLFGIGLTLQLFTNGQYFLFLTVMLPLYLIFSNIQFLKEKKNIFMLIIAVSVFLILSSWYIIILLGHDTTVRPLVESMAYTFNESLYQIVAPEGFNLTLPLLLSLLGLYLIIKQRKKQKWALPFILLAFIAFLFSLGPFASYAPYTLLYKFWPMFNILRTPARFLIFTLLAISLFSGFFVNWLLTRKIKLLLLASVGLFLFSIIWKLLLVANLLEDKLFYFVSGPDSLSSSMIVNNFIFDVSLILLVVIIIIAFIIVFRRVNFFKYYSLVILLIFLGLNSYFLYESPYFNKHIIIEPNQRIGSIVYSFLADIDGDFSVVEYPFIHDNCVYLLNALQYKKKLVGGCVVNVPPLTKEFEKVCGKTILENNLKCKELLKLYDVKYAIYNSNLYENWLFVKDNQLKSNESLVFMDFLMKDGSVYLFKVNLDSFISE